MWQLSAWGIPGLVGIGCALMFAPTYWGRLIACLLFAISGLWGGTVILMWGRATPQCTRGHRLKLFGAGGVDLIFTIGLIWFAFPRAEAQISTIPPVTVTGGDNVVSVGQIGGVTAREVTINNLPIKPEFRILERNDVENPDGTHTVTITGTVASPIAPGLLFLQIQAAGMQDAKVMAAPVGRLSTANVRNVRTEPGFYSTEIPSPHGDYIITVVTAGTHDVKLNASF